MNKHLARYYHLVPMIMIISTAIIYSGQASSATMKRMDYGYNDVTVTNPERGFYHHPGSCQNQVFNATFLSNLRKDTNDNTSLIMCIFYLYDPNMPNWDYRTSEIPTDSNVNGPVKILKRQADAFRAAGLKMILRIAYRNSEQIAIGEYDVRLDKALRDIEALKQVIQENSDVIAVLESGFVGEWGEGWRTSHYGDQGHEIWTARKEIIDALQKVLPNHKVQVRRPDMKRNFFPPTGVTTSSDFSNNNAISRLGFHNDCFLRDNGNADGYYGDAIAAKQQVIDDSKYVPVGGETCFPIYDSPTWRIEKLDSWLCTGNAGAEGEMKNLHFSYLNRVPQTGLGNWRIDEASCFERLVKNIGYRFRVISATAPDIALRGKLMPFSMSLVNEGYARPINNHRLYLVFANPTTGNEVWSVYMGGTNYWTPATAITVQAYTNPATPPLLFPNVQIPTDTNVLPAGDYQLYLRIEDSSPRLKNDPRYAVQLMSYARTPTGNKNVWNAAKGMNNLWLTVHVN